MFTNIKGVWGFIGVGLFLVALYLVLEHAMQAVAVITAGGDELAHVYATLQARAS